MKRKARELNIDFTLEQAKHVHGSSCGNPHVVKKPLSKIESEGFLGIKFYSEHCYQCLHCGWESDRVIIRTI